MEKGSFPSAMAELDEGFLPVVDKIRAALLELDGKIKITGHTDNNPIKTSQFRSNWDLSSARALSVMHELIKKEGLKPSRFEIVGSADTKPIAPNDTPENRSRNRRVDIELIQKESKDKNSDEQDSILNELAE